MTLTTSRPAASTEVAAENRRSAQSRWGLGHLPALDGLRGAAVAAVLLYHGGYLTGGYLGVDLFFVLSGFLITSLLLSEQRGTGRIDLKAFWARRARRLLPALFLLLGGVALFALIWAEPIDLGQIRRSGLATLAYVANWQQILRGTSYWDISLNPSPLQHTWSLAIEEQFYLVWPLVITVVLRKGGRRRGRRVQRFCLGLAAASVGLYVVLHAAGASDNRIYEGTDTRAFALLLGAALAGWRATNGPVEDQRRWPAIEAVGIVAAVLLGLAWATLEGTSALLYRGGLPFCSVLATLVLCAATNRRSPVLGRIFRVRVLCGLGIISYGLYLWHWPIYLVLNEARTGLSGLALLAVRVTASLAVSILSYVLVEQPIRAGTLRGRPLHILTPLAAGLAVVVLIVATTGGTSPAAVNQAAAPTQAAAKVAGAPTVMLVGDSVGNSVAGPIIDDPWTYRINPVNETVIGCELMYRGHKVQNYQGVLPPFPDCTATYRADVAKYRPKVVMVVFGAASDNKIDVGGGFEDACAPGYRKEQVRLHKAAIDDLRSSGATVVLVTVARSNSTFHGPEWNQHIDCYNDVLRSIAGNTPGVKLVDLDHWLCPDGQCRQDLDGATPRPDGLHFNGPGGRAVSAYLTKTALAEAGVPLAPVRSEIPAWCADVRQVSSPILDVLDRRSAGARRSSNDRLKYVDYDRATSRAPQQAATPLRQLQANADAIRSTLGRTPDGTALRLAAFPAPVQAALRDLRTYLDQHCTGR